MPDFKIEENLHVSGAVFGLDEAGRGPWCGPVVAACVYWPNFEIPEELVTQIDDSKKLTPLTSGSKLASLEINLRIQKGILLYEI